MATIEGGAVCFFRFNAFGVGLVGLLSQKKQKEKKTIEGHI